MVEDDIDEDADARRLARRDHRAELVPVPALADELVRDGLVRRPPLAAGDVLRGGRDLNILVPELAQRRALGLDGRPVPLEELNDRR
jgi:hypothetical protein